MLPQHSTCTTGDPDTAAAFIATAWGAQGRVDGLDPGHPIRIARLEIDHVSVTEAEFPGVLHFDTDQWPCYLVTEVKAGAVRIGSAARGERCTAGDVALAARPGRSCSAETEDARVSLTALPPEALQRIIGDPAIHGAPGVRFTSNRPRSDAAAAQWETTVDYVTSTLTSVLCPEDTTLVVGGAVSLLASTLLYVFPNTFADAKHVEHPQVSAPLVRQAIDFIQANCARDISMADIASAINVTPRAVQYMFRRHLDTTPMAYLRRVRLDHAHRDLLGADPSHDTVSAIAIRWGFAHTGRFSQVYRAEFGESPSVTLHG